MLLVTGATGNVGGELVRALAAAGEDVRALTRHANPGRPGVETVVGDLNRPETLAEALDGTRGVFLLAGYADMPGLLAAIAEAGVEHVVLLSSGAVVDGDMANAIVRYNALSEQAVRESGLSWTILRPSGYFSNALQWTDQLRAGDVIREPFATVPIAAIDPFDIAAVAAMALTGRGHDGATYRLTGPEPIYPADRVRLLAKVLRRELRFEPISDADARADMEASMPPEYVDAFMSFFSDGTYDDSRVHPTVAQLTGRQPRSFEQWARAHAAAFS